MIYSILLMITAKYPSDRKLSGNGINFEAVLLLYYIGIYELFD